MCVCVWVSEWFGLKRSCEETVEVGRIPGNPRSTQGLRVIEAKAGTGVPAHNADEAWALFHDDRVSRPQTGGVTDGAVLLKVNPSPVRISRLRNLGDRPAPRGEAGYDENARKQRLCTGLRVSKIFLSFHIQPMVCFPATNFKIFEAVK